MKRMTKDTNRYSYVTGCPVSWEVQCRSPRNWKWWPQTDYRRKPEALKALRNYRRAHPDLHYRLAKVTRRIQVTVEVVKEAGR